MNMKLLRKYDVEDNENIRMYYEKAVHYPTLKTVMEVENVLKKAEKPLNKMEIKRMLEKKIMHQTLNIILAYLMERNMIIETEEGFVWIYNPEHIRKMEKKTIRVR
jgi:hypothetical protein